MEMSKRRRMADPEHTMSGFEWELQRLSSWIAEMGGLVERQVLEAIEALSNGDQERAQRVVLADAKIDYMQREVEEAVVALLASRHAAAIDPRQAIAILRIASELERIGDLAKNIGKRIGALGRAHLPRQFMGGLVHITTLILGQLRDVLDSLATRDVARAVEVWSRDQDVDRLYTSLFQELLSQMAQDPATVACAVHLVFCTKNIERMGDHATNIAEAIFYLVRGHALWGERPKADLTPMMVSATPSLTAEQEDLVRAGT
jgi:phosphate transport system protein